MDALAPVVTALARHARVAFEFSAGKDSLAALLFLRPYWDHLTVYHCDSGDAMPETRAVVDRIAAELPHFKIVPGRVRETWGQYGRPSDVIPYGSTEWTWHLGVGETPLMQDRYLCCYRAIMQPLHEAVLADGNTLIVRGQKRADFPRGPLSSGDVMDGIEYLYPIEDWTDADCFDFLTVNGVQPSTLYAAGQAPAGGCLGCTAYVTPGRAAYLSAHHPDRYAEYREHLTVIAHSLADHVNHISKEMEYCHGL